MIDKYPSPDRIGKRPAKQSVLARIGRIGTKFETSDYQATIYGIRRLGVVAIAALSAGAIGIGLHELDNAQTSPLEKCVQEKTGEIIELNINPKNGEIMRPATMDETEKAALVACEAER